MFPVKDDVPSTRFPAVTALLTLAAIPAVILLGGGVLRAALAAWVLWMFGGTVENELGRPRFIALSVVAGVTAAGVATAVGVENDLGPVIAFGAISGVLGAHFALHPRARVISLAVLPLVSGIYTFPAPVMSAAWFTAAALLETGTAGLGAGETLLAGAASFGLALAAARLLAVDPRATGRDAAAPGAVD